MKHVTLVHKFNGQQIVVDVSEITRDAYIVLQDDGQHVYPRSCWIIQTAILRNKV